MGNEVRRRLLLGRIPITYLLNLIKQNLNEWNSKLIPKKKFSLYSRK